MANSPSGEHDETAYLLGNPANAERLLESIAQLERGEGIERELLEDAPRTDPESPAKPRPPSRG